MTSHPGYLAGKGEEYQTQKTQTYNTDLFIIKELWEEEIISQIVWIIEVCDQNGDRVSKTNQSCHICMRLKKVFS